VKVLRPGIQTVIGHDVQLLHALAGLIERLWWDGKRLKPREVVAEFAKHLDDELDLIREAANCSQLHRNFADSPLLAVPEGVLGLLHPGSHGDDLDGWHAHLPARRTAPARGGRSAPGPRRGRDLLHPGVPGRLLPRRHAPGQRAGDRPGPATSPWTSASWAPSTRCDKNYLAQNFLAFFQRDYRKGGPGPPGRGLGAGRTPGPTNSRPPSAPCANRCSTGP
jgi:ubiquinone biosynthesis protein